MRKLYTLIFLSQLFINCNQSKNRVDADKQETEFNHNLANECEQLVVIDQLAANVRQGKYRNWSTERWSKFQDSVFTSHEIRLKEILDEFGYPGYNLVGEEGSINFWLMVQHCDHNPSFQLSVLDKLKIEVENKNADPSTFGLLTDRVKLNLGEPQIYGTQVDYNELGQAYPKNLADSLNVNKIRAEVGLESIEEYLNNMTQMHFDMNKEHLKSKGITKPILYDIKI